MTPRTCTVGRPIALHRLLGGHRRPDEVVPGLRDGQLGDDERTIIHENVARVRAALGWIEMAVDTGQVDVDPELARLLQGA